MTPRTLSPHQHKLLTELETRLRNDIHAIESLHVDIAQVAAALYDLTGLEAYARFHAQVSSVPYPIIHQGLPQ